MSEIQSSTTIPENDRSREPTPAQDSVLRHNGHTVIIANAGSGKTFVLVQQYFQYLLDHPDVLPRDIVTITFTEASAKDIKKKIRKTLERRLQHETDPLMIDRLIEIEENLRQSNISTIHSFCVSLLRKYPIEAGIDTSFGVLTPPEDRVLRDECISKVLFDALEEVYHSEDKASHPVYQLMMAYGRANITAAVTALFNNRSTVERFVQRYAAESLNDSYQRITKHIENYISQIFNEHIDLSYYESLYAFLKEQIVQNARDLIYSYNTSVILKEKYKSLKSLLKLLFTSNPTHYRKKIFHSKDDTADMPLPDHLELIKFYSDLFDPFFTDDPQNLREGIQHVHTFLSLYQRALQMYQLRKSEFSLLDYDDQLLKTRDLLMRDDVRREVAESYPLILVDEYQDTDDLQYDIIKSLTLDYTASNRLIIVGDPKQSIYRFRNADIALFLRSRDEISRTSTPHIGVFAESFRMCEVPMAFINFFFRKIFPQRSHCEPTIEYTDLINGRCSDDPGSVCFLKYESAGNTGDAVNTDGENMSSASDEATMIARQIIELHNGTYQYGEPLRTAPSVPLEDICILVRKRKLLPIIEHTLTQYSIPFHTYQSSGFYNAQEIIDITNYLTFLVNNHNDISLLGVLRSPYFMISDVQIFRIAFWNQKNNTIRDASLWDRLQNYMLNEQTDKSEELQRAYRQLDENRRLAGRIRTNRLIDKIYKESFIFGTITLLPDAEQKKANLRKYAAIALEYDAKGLKGLYDFVSRVQFLAERDDSERPAEKNTEKGKVHLMTIHNAKGLEFDVVFLPFLQSLYNRTDSMDNIAMVKDIALHLKSKQTNSLTEFIKIHNMIAAIEEEKRIFYVAMTRAKDHLFLSASIRRKNDGGIAYLNGTYLQWIAELFGQELAASSTINEPLTFYNKDTKEHTTKNIAIPFRIRTDVPEQPLKLDGSVVIAEPAFADVHVRPLPKAEGKTRYSPTQLNIYRQCPTKYYLQYVLGLNEDTVLPLGFSDEDDSEVSKGTMLGSLVHAMLESLNIISNDGVLLEQQFDEKLYKIAGKFGNNVDNIIAQYRESVMQHCRNFISSPFGKYAAAASEYFTELPMRMPVTENQSLSGIIDRLYRDDNGWHILDYKTDINLDRSEKYEFQLQCYAYMVSKLHKSERYHTHIFFTRTGVSVDSVYTAEDLERFGTEIRSVISAILADKKVSSLSHIVRNRTECKHCQFYLSEKDRCLADDQKPAVTPKR